MGKTMHVRLAERRDVIQTERWVNLARSIERTSDKVLRILGNTESVAAQRLIVRLQLLRCHLSDNVYSGAHLSAAVIMVDEVAVSLSELVAEVGLAPKPPSERHGPP
jgi:hypothetical protein